MPAIQPYIVEPIWEQFVALLCPKGKRIIRSAATGRASRTG